MTGRFHNFAKFRPSCQTPWLVAPSPKKLITMRSSLRYWQARARPVAIGIEPPTMPVPP